MGKQGNHDACFSGGAVGCHGDATAVGGGVLIPLVGTSSLCGESHFAVGTDTVGTGGDTQIEIRRYVYSYFPMGYSINVIIDIDVVVGGFCRC